MLLRYRRSGLDAIIGPLYETAPPAGGAPAGDPAPPATGTPPAAGAGGSPAPAGNGPADDRSNWIPRERFDQVNTEYARLKKAEDDRAEKEAKARGDFEALNAQEKEKTAAAEAKAERIARRGAFVSRAAGKVADAEAAFKLADADGMLSDLAVDDDGNADPKVVDKIVDKLIEKYEFLKGTDKTRSFGEPAGGNGGAPQDTSKMTARDMLRAGYAESPRR
jgi:hypothetical protein